jgi:hypothetical protein
MVFSPPECRRLIFCLALSVTASWAGAESQPASPAIDSNALLLAVVADRQVLSDAIPAFRSGPHLLLPLGELAGIATVAITVQPERGTASGFIIREAREFALNVRKGTVTVSGVVEPFDTALVTVWDDDIYVASDLLARWLPIDIDVNFSTLTLKLTPREKLPFQLRLERERAGEQMGFRNKREDPDYPLRETPYRLVDMPFIDQTVSTNLSRDGSGGKNTIYSTYLTGDLLGVESTVYLTNGAAQEKQNVRYTLGRHDPDAGLLGPLGARALVVGNIAVPAVENASRGNFFGTGMSLSNRLLTRPTSFDRHSLKGDLPPGWDVELFYNDMLVATQQSRADGTYNFDDQPLMYGANEFRLVFHGPLGQIRVERQSFTLDQSLSRPGDFFYDFAEHRDLNGFKHSVAQFDYGVARGLAVTGGVVSQPLGGEERRYANIGLRSFWQSLILNGYYVSSPTGGSLIQGEVKTRIGDFSIDASHTRLSDFSSDYFGQSQRSRQKLRLNGPLDLPLLPRLPLTVELLKDAYDSGDTSLQGSAMISAYQSGTWITNRLAWTAAPGTRSAGGTLLLGRRVADVGVNAQFGYSVNPASRFTDMSVFANKSFASGYTVSGGVSHSLSSRDTYYSAALNKGIGSYGFGVTANYSNRGAWSIGIQFFMSMTREPRRSAWSFDAVPKANSGAVSARAFMDTNMNGVMDESETPIKGVGFTVNGSGMLPARTDSTGVALLSGLQPFEKANIAVEIETLEEPEWMPLTKGICVVPRPGRVAEMDFPIVVASEIDGTVYLRQDGTQRGIGGVVLELVDVEGKVAAGVRTSWDGYYILAGIRPGKYLLRVSPEQAARLRLVDVPSRKVDIGGDGKAVDGMDIVISRQAPDLPGRPGGGAER